MKKFLKIVKSKKLQFILIYNFEKLFDNLKIIDSKTTKNEIEIYIENIKDRNFEFDVEVFNNYFSALKLVNDLS